MTINQVLLKSSRKLKSSKTPRLDAELLLAYVLKKTREWILSHPEHKINESQTCLPTGKVANYKQLVSRRSKGEPIAYITNRKEFYGLDFEVSKDTLIPRPETELMVEKVLYKVLYNTLYNTKFTLIDVGTGSGCVIVSLANQLFSKSKISTTNCQLLAIDNSSGALKIAQKNARAHRVDRQIKFLKGSLLQPTITNTQYLMPNKPLLITANLPYISESDYENLNPSVKKFEPKQALLSGPDGLDHYRELLDQLKILTTTYNLPTTTYFEISSNQKTLIKKEIKKRFPKAKIKFHQDLANKWRLVEIELV